MKLFKKNKVGNKKVRVHE